jgi:glutathione S-transferase
MEERTVHVVTESLVILEFVEDYGNAASTSAASCSAPSLLPPHPATRAAARLAAKRFDERFVPPFYALLRGGLTAEDQKRHKQTLTEELEWLERHADAAVSFESWSFFSSFVVEGKVEKKNPENSHRKRKKKKRKKQKGPYYCGARFSLADAALVPFFLRMFELKARSGFEIPARCERLIRWYGACASRSSVIGTLNTPPGEEEGEGGEGGGGEGGSGSGIASNGNDWEVALTKFFVGYLGPRPAAESAAA